MSLSDRASRVVDRRLWLLVGLVVIATVAGVAWMVGSRVKSPAQAAADAEPPEPSLVTAEVVLRRLADTMVTEGEVTAARVTEVIARTPAGATAAVVVDVLAVGGRLVDGGVAAVVSGRPVIMLEGSIPAYRDLQRGSVGRDVRQLEEALVRLGHLDGEADEMFDRSTELAVETLYEATGFDPPPPDLGATTLTGRHAPRSSVLATEVLYVTALPVEVAAVDAAVGDVVEDGAVLLRATAVQPEVTARAHGTAADLVTPGLAARVFIDAASLELVGVVTTVGPAEADPVGGFGRSVTIDVDGLTARHLGMLARVVIETAATDDEVLAVPVGAVFTDTDGQVRVLLVRDVEPLPVPIHPGRVIGGFVELTDPDTAIVPGALVVVGWQ